MHEFYSKPSSTYSNETSEEQTDPEFYFSCHEKIVTGNYLSDSNSHPASIMSDVFDPRDTNSMPNMSRSTLMDQVDYELDGLKVNEVSSSEIYESNKITNLHQYEFSNKKNKAINDTEKKVIRDIVFKSLGHLNGKVSPKKVNCKLFIYLIL